MVSPDCGTERTGNLQYLDITGVLYQLDYLFGPWRYSSTLHHFLMGQIQKLYKLIFCFPKGNGSKKLQLFLHSPLFPSSLGFGLSSKTLRFSTNTSDISSPTTLVSKTFWSMKWNQSFKNSFSSVRCSLRSVRQSGDEWNHGRSWCFCDGNLHRWHMLPGHSLGSYWGISVQTTPQYLKSPQYLFTWVTKRNFCICC